MFVRSNHLLRFDSYQRMKMSIQTGIRHQAISISISNRLYVLSPEFYEVVVILILTKKVFGSIGVVVNMIESFWLHALKITLLKLFERMIGLDLTRLFIIA